jgi:hypothetical protein
MLTLFSLASNSCLFANLLGKACSSCLYAMRLFSNRNLKRKASNPICSPSKKCNVRPLARLGLEEKIASQKKNCRITLERKPVLNIFHCWSSWRKIASIWREFFEEINTDDVQSYMKLIWKKKKWKKQSSPSQNPHMAIVGIHRMFYKIY